MAQSLTQELAGILLVLAVALLFSCEEVENFDEIDQPRFTGSYAPDMSGNTEKLKFVTFNIEYAIKIDEAIEELSTDEGLKDADIIFFQEMDEKGSEAIAQRLEYNYVFYPSNRNTEGQLFGLSILSKWPLINDEKILLPHATPLNNRKRIAISAETVIGDKHIRLYNIHPATLSVPKAHRREQFEMVVKHLLQLEQNQEVDHVIIAGDFNTDKSIDIEYLVNLYANHGFTWASREVGPTWQKFDGLVKFTLDHIFSRGLTLEKAGKPSKTSASDHLPVWAEWTFQK